MNIGVLLGKEKRPTGISKCTNALYDTLFEIDSENSYYAFDTQSDWDERFETIPLIDRDYMNYALAYPAYAYELDIVHGHFDAFLLPPKLKCRSVYTVHDLRGYAHPEWDNKQLYDLYEKKINNCIRSSDAIIAVSEYTKGELIEYLQIPEERIRVIYWGLYPKDKFSGNGIKPSIEGIIKGEFLLNVSGIDRNKNQVGTIKSFIRFKKENPGIGIKLVLTGPARNTQELDDFMKGSDYQKWQRDIIFTGYVSDDELVWLYKNALAFLYLSFFEGFGVPILEAMATECAVISSDRTSLPEVGGDAVLYCDPYDIEEIAEAMNKIVFDEIYRRELQKKGFERSKLFSYEKTARQTLELYQQLV